MKLIKRKLNGLLKDAKENAEHVMLVDLARNDLSRLCDDVQVAHYRKCNITRMLFIWSAK
jgi:anthranilate synthase component 1